MKTVPFGYNYKRTYRGALDNSTVFNTFSELVSACLKSDKTTRIYAGGLYSVINDKTSSNNGVYLAVAAPQNKKGKFFLQKLSTLPLYIQELNEDDFSFEQTYKGDINFDGEISYEDLVLLRENSANFMPCSLGDFGLWYDSYNNPIEAIDITLNDDTVVTYTSGNENPYLNLEMLFDRCDVNNDKKIDASDISHLASIIMGEIAKSDWIKTTVGLNSVTHIGYFKLTPTTFPLDDMLQALTTSIDICKTSDNKTLLQNVNKYVFTEDGKQIIKLPIKTEANYNDMYKVLFDSSVSEYASYFTNQVKFIFTNETVQPNDTNSGGNEYVEDKPGGEQIEGPGSNINTGHHEGGYNPGQTATDQTNTGSSEGTLTETINPSNDETNEEIQNSTIELG